MSVEKALRQRSGDKCELCSSEQDLTVYAVPPVGDVSEENSILVCSTCAAQINEPESMDLNHWRCLNDSMWSTVPAVQVMAYRLLNSIKSEGWPQDLLDMLYLDDETLTWAKAESSDDSLKYIDSNGAELKAGDSVVLIKDLNVKGGGFTAKRGTAVRNIGLAADDPEHIVGKVNGQTIYILTKFVKKY